MCVILSVAIWLPLLSSSPSTDSLYHPVMVVWVYEPTTGSFENSVTENVSYRDNETKVNFGSICSVLRFSKGIGETTRRLIFLLIPLFFDRLHYPAVPVLLPLALRLVGRKLVVYRERSICGALPLIVTMGWYSLIGSNRRHSLEFEFIGPLQKVGYLSDGLGIYIVWY